MTLDIAEMNSETASCPEPSQDRINIGNLGR